MRALKACVFVVVFAVFSAWSSQAGTLQGTVPAKEVKKVKLAVRVGSVEVNQSDSEELKVTVVPSASPSSALKVMGEAAVGEDELSKLKLDLPVSDGVLEPRLLLGEREVAAMGSWTVAVPKGMDVDVELGVGDVEVSGELGKVKVKTGVGGVEFSGKAGEIDVETGTGDIEIGIPAADVGSVRLHTGTGDIELEGAPEGVPEPEGLVAKSLRWKGPGNSSVEAHAGIGEITLKLMESK